MGGGYRQQQQIKSCCVRGLWGYSAPIPNFDTRSRSGISSPDEFLVIQSGRSWTLYSIERQLEPYRSSGRITQNDRGVYRDKWRNYVMVWAVGGQPSDRGQLKNRTESSRRVTEWPKDEIRSQGHVMPICVCSLATAFTQQQTAHHILSHILDIQGGSKKVSCWF